MPLRFYSGKICASSRGNTDGIAFLIFDRLRIQVEFYNSRIQEFKNSRIVDLEEFRSESNIRLRDEIHRDRMENQKRKHFTIES